MKTIGKRSIPSLVKFIMAALWYLSLSSLVVITSMLILRGFQATTTTMRVPVVFELEANNHQIQAKTLGIDDAEMGQAMSELNFQTSGGWFYQLNLMVAILGLIILLWILYHLRGIFSTLWTGSPFVKANARRIRWIGLAIIIGELLKSFLVGIENYYVMMHFTADGLNFGTSLDIQGATIVVGLAIIIISEVFRVGVQLEQHQSLIT